MGRKSLRNAGGAGESSKIRDFKSSGDGWAANGHVLFLAAFIGSAMAEVELCPISIPGFQEYDEDVETWMACDVKDSGFQMLNDDEIVTSVRKESDSVGNETVKDEDNNEVARVHQMLKRFLR
ncbi:uncharacterized protein TNCV_914701 [Trichonephila clavipes]|uniref:Uncharacterized protein n=1 Tax=Trichonephila clavipes TaxID=2585209 RepID=A0A8X6RF43_TRICX|nr:uncharacterized protein TNCV_914701 [Trichonephila clavipes]